MLGRSGEFSTNDELHTHLTATLDKQGKIRVHLQVTDRRVAAISGHHLKGELPAATRKEIKEMSEVLQRADPKSSYRDPHPKAYLIKRQDLSVEAICEEMVRATNALNERFDGNQLEPSGIQLTPSEIFERLERCRRFIERVDREVNSSVDCPQEEEEFQRRRVEIAKRLTGTGSSGKGPKRKRARKSAVNDLRRRELNRTDQGRDSGTRDQPTKRA